MKISIVTPTYNSAAYLEETIHSILNQSYKNFEHIIIDGQSTDNTVDLIKKYSHIQWFSEKDNGQSNAINKGFRLATGDILAWQNSDDLYFPDTFETVVDFFQKNPDVDIVYGYYQLIEAGGEWICDVKPIDWNLWLFAHGRFVPVQPTVFWRRKVYELVGDLDESLHYCMDVDFYCRSSKEFKFACIHKFLGKFRVHPQSKTQNVANIKKIRQEWKAILSHSFNYSFMDSLICDFFYYRSLLAKSLKTKFFKK